MSNQRHAPPSDGRFGRDRSPSRPALPAVHPGRNAMMSDSANAEGHQPGSTPQGPKTFGDQRGPGPSAPHSRGFNPRANYRGEFREREPFRGPRDVSPQGDRSWRDYDRRDGPQDRNDFRSSRDAPPRDFDASRGRRGFREGPPGRFSDSRPGPSFTPSRDEYPRGRGRGEWPPRGRGRGYHEDRPGFRGRSRSPRGYRPAWDRDGGRDDRSDDRYDSLRYERRESDDRDERAREADRWRRDHPQISTTAAKRESINSPGPNSPSVEGSSAPPHSTPTAARPSSVSDRDSFPQRRGSTTSGRGLGRQDSSLPKDAQSTGDPSSRPPTPPPEVPAFGSSSSTFKPASGGDGPWNVWKAPSEPKAASTSAPPSNGQAPSPAKAPLAPTAKRPENPQPAGSSTELRQVRSREDTSVPDRKSPTPAMTTTSSTTNRTAVENQSVDTVLPSRAPPTGPRQIIGAPLGPKAQTKFDTNPPSGPRNAVSPAARKAMMSPQSVPASAPSGPRAALPASKFGGNMPPTGPRSGWNGPVAPARSVPTGPTSDRPWQPQQPLRRPDVGHAQASFGQGLVPAKRDHDGLERDSARSKTSANTDTEVKRDEEDTFEGVKAQENVEFVGAADAATAPGANGAKSTMYSDDEDEMDLSELDSAQNEQKFERNKMRLEAQRADLSLPTFRASEPLELLSLLSNLLLQDPQLFLETRQAKAQARLLSEPQTESETPKTLDDLESAPEPTPRPSPKLTPSPVGSPELKALPFLAGPLTPLSENEILQENLKRQSAVRASLYADIERRLEEDQSDEEQIRNEYERHYRSWRSRTRHLERLQKEQEDMERQESTEAAAEAVPTEMSPVITSAAEPRRRGFTSEYELQKILEMSREQAEREAQARKEKELGNSRPDYDREAKVPDLRPDLDLRPVINQDVDRRIDVRTALHCWDLEPPQDDFSQREHETMLQNFKEYPKKFGKIAQSLRGRTYKDCINHYYATKWDGKYKPPRDKRKTARVKTPKVRGSAGARPRANQLISNLDDAKPELYDGEETNAPIVAVTESGRPRRAAAPSFRDREQADQNSSTPRRGGAKLEAPVGEKPARRPRGTGKDRVRRKTAATSATTRQGSASPERQATDGKSNESRLPSSHGNMDVIQIAPQADASSSLAKMDVQPFATEHPGHTMGVLGADSARIQTVRSGHTGPSSYWSVHEVTQFPQLVKHYGTDWVSIANAMGTKSQTMVKNYFGRLKNTGKDGDLELWAKEADARRERGENVGAPPTSNPASRRPRPEQPLTSGPRALAPSTDAMEITEDAVPVTPQPAAAHLQRTPYVAPQTSSSQFEGRHSRSTSYGQPIIAAMSPQMASAYPPGSQANADVRAAYPIERREVVGSRSTELQATQGPPVEASAYTSPSKNLWERSARGGEIFQGFVQGSSGGLIRASSPSRFSERQLFGPSTARGGHPSDRPTSHDDLGRGQIRRAESPQPPSGLRYVTDYTNPRPASTSIFDPARPQPHAVTREDSRRVYTAEPPRQVPPAAKPEPRKTSNLAAILNADPDEPKAISHPGPSATPSSSVNTPPQYATPAHSGYGPSVYGPPRPLSQPGHSEALPISRHSHERVGYNPGEPVEPKQREPGLYRPEWPASKPQERPVEMPPAYDHRSAVRGYEPRYNASPPPLPPHASGPTEPPPPRSYEQRIPSSHYGTAYRAASPPIRGYNYTPAGSLSHSRDSSISRIASGQPSHVGSREAQYVPEHRHTSSLSSTGGPRLGERGPPPGPPPAINPGGNGLFGPHSQPYAPSRAPPPSSHSMAQSTSREGHASTVGDWARERERADWTSGIQAYREAEARGEPPRHEPPPDSGRERYAPSGYGPVGGAPPPPAYGARGERG